MSQIYDLTPPKSRVAGPGTGMIIRKLDKLESICLSCELDKCRNTSAKCPLKRAKKELRNAKTEV